jgi:hypothetical protein
MEYLKFEKVSLEEAKHVHDGPPREGGRPDWRRRRGTAPAEPLAAATEAWMATLPDNIRPVELAVQFPRIANKICDLWSHSLRCGDYPADLLIVRRNDRQGFPVAVARELGKLALHHATLHPPTERSWHNAR